MKYLHPDSKILGMTVPLAALVTKDSCGTGEFLDLIPLASFCTSCEITLIQLLPVNDTGLQSSPYSALSAFALNPLYGRPSKMDSKQVARKAIENLSENGREPGRFIYHERYREKIAIYQEIFSASKTEILKAWNDIKSPLHVWAKSQSWLPAYAVYTVLKQENKDRHWKEWGALANVDMATIEKRWQNPKLLEKHLFPVWLQHQLFLQFDEAAQGVRALGIDLKGDIPILMNEDSCDVWSRPALFSREAVAGAPPDMFSPSGQNWQFPLYRWDELAKDNYAWWKDRLAVANRWYSAFRIDHVLGFFRIWACSLYDNSAVLGWYTPGEQLTPSQLQALGFTNDRLRWLSEPHIETHQFEDPVQNIEDRELRQEVRAIIRERLLEQIPGEELWLFKPEVRGEKDIHTAGLPQALEGVLLNKWRDRCLIPHATGKTISFTPSWYWKDSTAWRSLSPDEQQQLETSAKQALTKSEKTWEKQGHTLLSVLSASVDMLACAEDLGAVPACVPKILKKLGISGLRVVRWYRQWDKEGSPYIPLSAYGAQSVATPAVHDSSTLREWWEQEAEQDVFSSFIKKKLNPQWNPETAALVLNTLAKAASNIFVVQLQDILHLRPNYYSENPADERINIPGTVSDFNWTWRMPQSLEALEMDGALKTAIREIANHRKGKSGK